MGNISFSEGTDAVVTTASQISSLADNFFTAYTSLYNLVENDLAACWKGEDYNAFKTKVNDEKHFFTSMCDVINEYANYLRNTANAHEMSMQDRKDQVQNCTFG